jgi:hypothetical protein
MVENEDGERVREWHVRFENDVIQGLGNAH